MRISLPLLLAGLIVAGQASAHGLWTELRRGHYEVIYGHGAEDNAFKAEKISGAWAYDATGRMIPVSVERLADHARLEPLRSPAVLAVALDNGAWSQTPDKQWINHGRLKVANSTHSLHTYKFSLAILHEGAQLPPLKTLRLAIVPQADPLEVGVGNMLRVQVLHDGEPATGVKLSADYRGMPDQADATTDAKGYADIRVRNAGLNVIAAELTVPTPGNPDIDEIGLFSSLSFLGSAHHQHD